MSFGNSECSVALSTSDKDLGSDQEGMIENGENTPSLSHKRKKDKQQNASKVPVKQSTQLFDSVRNVARDNVGEPLN